MACIWSTEYNMPMEITEAMVQWWLNYKGLWSLSIKRQNSWEINTLSHLDAKSRLCHQPVLLIFSMQNRQLVMNGALSGLNCQKLLRLFKYWSNAIVWNSVDGGYCKSNMVNYAFANLKDIVTEINLFKNISFKN